MGLLPAGEVADGDHTLCLPWVRGTVSWKLPSSATATGEPSTVTSEDGSALPSISAHSVGLAPATAFATLSSTAVGMGEGATGAPPRGANDCSPASTCTVCRRASG